MRTNHDSQFWQAAQADMLAVLARHGIRDQRLLQAMATIPRHRFIPDDYCTPSAYGDHPNPIGEGQTISQPFIVAHMTSLLELTPTCRVLEIGTGSGYQTAVLASLAGDVYTIERLAGLAAHARQILTELGYANLHCRHGDGYQGWPEAAPFDRILLTCAPPTIPPALVDQLADGGRLVLPVGVGLQSIHVLSRSGNTIHRQEDIPVRFVPMVADH